MRIYVDTRQKASKHEKKHNQMVDLGIELISKKLDVGDYMTDEKNISIDTKQDLQELYGNVLSDASRFMKEVRRAKDSNIQLIVLIEQGNIKTISDIPKWKPKFGMVNSKVLMKKVYGIHISYGTEFIFCDKRVTGKKIIELLKG